MFRWMAAVLSLTVLPVAHALGAHGVSRREVRADLLTSMIVGQQTPNEALAETLGYLKGRLDDRTIDGAGVTRRTQFTYTGCGVRFTAQYSPVPLFIQTDFSLTDIGSVELEEASDRQWFSTSVVFRSPRGREVIHTPNEQGKFLSIPKSSTSEDLNVFRWRVGSVCAGCANSFKDIGDKIVKAFRQAVELCGGGDASGEAVLERKNGQAADQPKFDLGSSISDLVSIQGIPERIVTDKYVYGDAWVQVANGRVISWWDPSHRLRLKNPNTIPPRQ
jgi:hypothetical protein